MNIYYKYSFLNLKITIYEDVDDLYIKRIEITNQESKERIKNFNKKFINTIYNFFDSYFYRKEWIQPPKFIMIGTEFEKLIWKNLQRVPFGKTISYQDLAIIIGVTTTYARAVGNACKKNLLPILIPCHRVIGKSLEIKNFSYGKEIKKWLLDHEGSLYKE